jgi:hypothetical protein
MNQHIAQMASAIADFYLERPVSEARQVLEAAFKKIEGKSHVHEYAALLREYADFLETSVDWTPERFRHWVAKPKPFGEV